MPGMRCTVAVCNNSRLKVDKSEKQISFYRFPKNKVIRQVWIQKCKRNGKWNWENCRICSEHFTTEDYERDLQAELLGLPPKKKLKSTAVPSLKLSKVTEQVLVSTQNKNSVRTKRLTNRNNKKLVKNVLENLSEAKNNDISAPPTSSVSLIASTPTVVVSQVTEQDLASTQNTMRTERFTNRSNKKLVKDILENPRENLSEAKNNEVSTPLTSSVSPIASPPTIVVFQTSNENPYDVLQKDYQRLISEHEFLKKQYLIIKKENDKLKLKTNNLERDLSHLSSKLAVEKVHRTKIETSMTQFLTGSTDIVIGKKNGALEF